MAIIRRPLKAKWYWDSGYASQASAIARAKELEKDGYRARVTFHPGDEEGDFQVSLAKPLSR